MNADVISVNISMISFKQDGGIAIEGTSHWKSSYNTNRIGPERILFELVTQRGLLLLVACISIN
jgi:hypothetical protein